MIPPTIISGDEFRTIRKNNGLTQQEMADNLGLSLSLLKLIETNQRPISQAVSNAVRCKFEALKAGELLVFVPSTFKWTPITEHLAIDLFCIEDMPLAEKAARVGCSEISIKKFHADFHDEIYQAQQDCIKDDDARVLEIMDLYGEGSNISHLQIANDVGVSEDAVRRLILAMEYDEEQNEPVKNDPFLLALTTEHAGRDFAADEVPDMDTTHFAPPDLAFATAVVLPFSESVARYKVDQSHTVPRPITLATEPFRVAA